MSNFVFVLDTNYTAFFSSIDHKILVRAWLPSPYIVVHSFEKGCKPLQPTHPAVARKLLNILNPTFRTSECNIIRLRF
jgi:hypothetical protein